MKHETDINEIEETYHRPWGFYKTLDMGENYQVKVITINPGGRLSLQRHFKRSEHWVVVSGDPKLTVGDRVKVFHPNESVFVPVETVHRMENEGNAPAVLIEVQCGSYLGEDDIERLEDVYGRV